MTDVHPHLPALAGRIFEPGRPRVLAAADLVFLALPHEESAALAAALPGHVAVVDLSASFRLADPQAWAAYYRTGHAGVLGLRAAGTARRQGPDQRRAPGRVAGLLRHRGDPGPRPPARRAAWPSRRTS